jgi:hypothetical protein
VSQSNASKIQNCNHEGIYGLLYKKYIKQYFITLCAVFKAFSTGEFPAKFSEKILGKINNLTAF